MKDDLSVAIDVEHIERSMAFEVSTDHASLGKHLNAAACALAAEVQRSAEKSAPIDLDLVDGFKGLVLRASEDLAGSRDEAFRMLGKASAVSSRNHHKIYKRELARTAQLYESLGLPPPKA